MERGGFVYIMTNEYNTTLYIGVTSNLIARVIEHKNKVFPNSFTARYNLHKLVYYEIIPSVEEAIIREKLLKGSNRNHKIKLIEGLNPNWNDLYDEISNW